MGAVGGTTETESAAGSSSSQVLPGARVMAVPSASLKVAGWASVGRSHVPFSSTPLRNTQAGPVPVRSQVLLQGASLVLYVRGGVLDHPHDHHVGRGELDVVTLDGRAGPHRALGRQLAGGVRVVAHPAPLFAFHVHVVTSRGK